MNVYMHLGGGKAHGPNTFVWIPLGWATFLFWITFRKPLWITWERLEIPAQWQPMILKNWISVGYLGFPSHIFLPTAFPPEGTCWSRVGLANWCCVCQTCWEGFATASLWFLAKVSPTPKANNSLPPLPLYDQPPTSPYPSPDKRGSQFFPRSPSTNGEKFVNVLGKGFI